MVVGRIERFTAFVVGVHRLDVRWSAMLLASLVLACGALGVGVRDMTHYGGGDLRARIVGVRDLLAGRSPYRNEADPTAPETQQDPRRFYQSMTRCTYPPPLLAIYAPTAQLSYPVQRKLWFVAEWASLLGSIVLLSRLVNPGRGGGLRAGFLCCALIFFASSYFWRLHTERGQYYSFLLFLSSVGSYLTVRRGDTIGAGIPFGLAVALRPTLLLLAAPLWIMGYRKSAVSTVAAAGATVAVTVGLFGISVWQDYFWLVKQYELETSIGKPKYMEMGATLPAPVPMIVDGANFTEELPHFTVNETFLGLCERASTVIPGFPRGELWPAMTKVAGLMALGTCIGVIWLWRRPQIASRYVIGASFLVVLGVEHFLPIRYSYADVMLLLPLAMFYRQLVRPVAWPALTAVACGLIVGSALRDSAAEAFRVFMLLVGLGTVAWAMVLIPRTKPKFSL